MKTGYLGKWLVGMAVSALLVGCGGGGGDGGGGDGGGGGGHAPSFKGLASLSGALGADKSGFAYLKLDTDGDGKFDGKYDRTISIEVVDGIFRFDGIKALKDKVLQGQLIVTVPGYAPFQQMVSLDAGQAYMIDASAALSKPALKEVVSLKGLSRSARMGSVIEFGIRKSGDKMQSFSRLMSLSQLAAEKNFPIEDGRVSTYTFGVASIPEDVSLVEATMQAFDSTKSEDIGNFPGSFRGYGEKGAKSAAGGDEVGLQSAAFDLLVLKDQNGQDIKLVSQDSKLSGTADLSTCVNTWTRHVTVAQAGVISSWGDYDTSTTEFEVPIWSNDNSESAWKFVGIANFDEANRQFEMCIPDDWGSGYLNCDSPISFEKPATVCMNVADQDGQPLSSIFFSGQSNAGEYTFGYTNSEGFVSLELVEANLSAWSFKYQGAITGGAPQAIDNGDLENVDTELCTYEHNLTLVSPFTAEVKVTAFDVNGSLATGASVMLFGSGLNKLGVTDANGTMAFMVEPDVRYTAQYNYGVSYVKVNGAVSGNETADSGVYADVNVTDINQAPSGYIYLTMSVVNKDLMTSMPVETSAWDSNGDSLTRASLKVDGEDVTLINETPSSSPGNYFSYGDLNVTGLTVGDHSIEAVFSDGSLTKTVSATFEVRGNRPPEINSPIEAVRSPMIDDDFVSFNIEENGSIVKSDTYEFYVGVTDPDGDSVTYTMVLDDANYTGPSVISDGEHKIVVTATDGSLSASKTFVFNAGNQKPIIGRASISPNPVNIHVREIMEVSAYVSDPDGDTIVSVVARDTNTSVTYELTGNSAGTWWYKYDVNASQIGVTDSRTFEFVATDSAGGVSDPFEASVRIRNENEVPLFYDENSAGGLEDKRIHVGDDAEYWVEVGDPENTRITLVCSIGERELLNTTETMAQFTITGLEVGEHTVVCVATDAEGGEARDSAVVTVFNEAPTFTKQPASQSLDMGTAVTLECEATDAHGDTPITYAWTVDGSMVTDESSTTLSLNYAAKGTHTISCDANDSYGKSAQSVTATITVIDPDEEVALTVKTGYPGIVVTVHDASNSLKMIKHGTTDASGEVTLMLPAGTTTTSFSLAFNPTVVVTSDQVFEDKKDDVLSDAANHCRWYSDLNISECATADWCTLLADEDSVPTWTVDAAQLKDKSDANITGASVDTNSDDEVSKAEFYQMALRMADKDSSGNLTWAELDDKTVTVFAFVGVPVKTYNFNLQPSNYGENMHGEGGLNCNNYPVFDINVTNASAYVGAIEVYGSGYGYGSANEANAFGAKVTSFMKDSDGKYDYIVKLRDESHNLAAVDLLLDKAAADLSGGKSYDAMSLTVPTTKDVNITNDVPHVWMGVSGNYKGIQGLDDSQGLGNSIFRYFSDSRLHYAISASEYLGTAHTEKSYEHKDYYGDGTLKNSYKASDYPMLDIDANLSTGIAKYSGTETEKVNVSKVVFNGYTRNDYAYYEDDNYYIEINRYADQTADFDLDLNISEVFPTGIVTVLEDAMDASTEKKVKVKAYEHKGKTAYEVLDMRVSGDYMGIQTSPKRLFMYGTMVGGGSEAP